MYDRDDETQGPGEEVEPNEAEQEPGDETPAEDQPAQETPEEASADDAQEAEPDGEGPQADAGGGPDAAQGAEAPSEPAENETHDEPVLVEHEPTVEDLLQAKLDESSARLRAVSKAYKDLQAEMKAFRERMDNQARFKAERQAFEQARAFFDPVQNLKRSLENMDDTSPMRDGLNMVLHQFMEAMKKLGMEEVPGVGAPFDPNVHEALALSPVADASQDGKVLMVHADGYTVNGKVLQAAQVVVGKYQEPAGEA